MRIIAFAGQPLPKRRVDPNRVMGRVANNLRSLKVSHSQLRIQIGMLRVSNDETRKQLVQLRADIHDLESSIKRKKQ